MGLVCLWGMLRQWQQSHLNLATNTLYYMYEFFSFTHLNCTLAFSWSPIHLQIIYSMYITLHNYIQTCLICFSLFLVYIYILYKYLSISMCACILVNLHYAPLKERNACINILVHTTYVEYTYYMNMRTAKTTSSLTTKTITPVHARQTHTHTFLRCFWMILHLKTFTTWDVSDVLTWSSTLPLVQGSLPSYETPWSEWQSQTLGWHCGKLVEHVTKTTFLIVAKQTHPMICQSQVGHWRM